MAFDAHLAERIERYLSPQAGLTQRRLFGCMGYLLDGNFCVGVWKDSLLARLGPEQAEQALCQPLVDEFDVTGRPMRGWVLIAPEALDDNASLHAWLDQAVAFVGTLPAK